MKTLVLKYFVGLLNSLADVLTECCSYHHYCPDDDWSIQ